MKADVVICPYRPPSSLREEAIAEPSEIEAQALWFEQFYQLRLATDDGRIAEIIQPGFWNHAGGPDFSRAVVRFSKDGKTWGDATVGNVEVHLRAGDWNAHGPSHRRGLRRKRSCTSSGKRRTARRSFPRPRRFGACRKWCSARSWSRRGRSCNRCVPRCCSVPCLARCRGAARRNWRDFRPGEIVDILRAAGMFSAAQKARRWFWREKLTSPEQALFEALAEALGFHANQIPMRLVAQRLPWTKLRALEPEARAGASFRPRRISAQRKRDAASVGDTRLVEEPLGNLVEGAGRARLRAFAAQPVEAGRSAAPQSPGTAAGGAGADRAADSGTGRCPACPR